MNGIEKITQRIAEDARKDGQELLSQAQEQSRAITERNKAQAAELAKDLAEKNAKNAADRRQRRIGVVELEARKLKLSAKQEMINQAFDNALAELTALPEDKMVELLGKLAAEASRTGSEQIVLSTSDHTRFGKKVAEAANALLAKQSRPANLTLSASPRSLGGGLMLSDGEVEINGTFGALVGALRSEMAGEVAKILF